MTIIYDDEENIYIEDGVILSDVFEIALDTMEVIKWDQNLFILKTVVDTED